MVLFYSFCLCHALRVLQHLGSKSFCWLVRRTTPSKARRDRDNDHRNNSRRRDSTREDMSKKACSMPSVSR